MSNDPNHIRAIAYLVNAIRPEWDRPGVERVLNRIDTDLPSLAHAAIAAASTRRDQRTPAVIAMTGPHWTNCTGEKPAVGLPPWTDQFAEVQPADPDTIRAIRARREAS